MLLCNCHWCQRHSLTIAPCHALYAGTYSGDATVSLSPGRSPKGIVQEVGNGSACRDTAGA